LIVDLDILQVESPKKPVSKKAAAPKKAPVTKTGVAKTTGPKKASEGGPKAKAAPRKTKKQKEEEAAAVAADQEDNEDEDMEDENEDGKSLNPNPVDQLANSQRVEPEVEAVARVASVESVQLAEVVSGDGNSEDDGDLKVVNLPIPMNDEYEAYIREMSLEAWLAWKAESEYTFNIIDIV
jgi:hypothetical protein